ncbi:MAG: hypothetical protein ACYS5V_10660 [Planctomycetota bacterium]
MALRLASYHNIHFFLELMRTARQHILDGSFADWRDDFLSTYSDS